MPIAIRVWCTVHGEVPNNYNSACVQESSPCVVITMNDRNLMVNQGGQMSKLVRGQEEHDLVMMTDCGFRKKHKDDPTGEACGGIITRDGHLNFIHAASVPFGQQRTSNLGEILSFCRGMEMVLAEALARPQCTMIWALTDSKHAVDGFNFGICEQVWGLEPFNVINLMRRVAGLEEWASPGKVVIGATGQAVAIIPGILTTGGPLLKVWNITIGEGENRRNLRLKVQHVKRQLNQSANKLARMFVPETLWQTEDDLDPFIFDDRFLYRVIKD